LREGALDFDPYEISRIINTPLTAFILSGQPVSTDEGKEDITLAHSVFEIASEIDSNGDGVHVKKHAFFTKALRELLLQATRSVLAILASVTDEYLRCFWVRHVHNLIERKDQKRWVTISHCGALGIPSGLWHFMAS